MYTSKKYVGRSLLSRCSVNIMQRAKLSFGIPFDILHRSLVVENANIKWRDNINTVGDTISALEGVHSSVERLPVLSRIFSTVEVTQKLFRYYLHSARVFHLQY